MNVTLLKALIALLPACMLFSGSLVLFARRRTVWSLLQVLGAGCLVVVVLTHICEALQLLPWMHGGLAHGPPGITSISVVRFLVYFYFPSDICFRRSQK
jgi:hypothetical protein